MSKSAQMLFLLSFSESQTLFYPQSIQHMQTAFRFRQFRNSGLSDRDSGILSVKAARNSGIPKNDVFTFCYTMCNLCTKF